MKLKINKPLTHGFTLVEIAIVLVVIGLLIAGVLRGQELISSGRVSAIAAQQNAIKTAYFGFIDRYKVQPGDMTAAQALMINYSAAPASAAGDGNVLLADSAAFFNNLAQAAFISCTPCSDPSILTTGLGSAAAIYTPPVSLSSANTLVNSFGQPLVFLYNSGNTQGSTAVTGTNTAGGIYFLSARADNAKPLLTTGGAVASNLLAELDRKADDGSASGGAFRYTDLSAINSLTSPFVSSDASEKCFVSAGAAGFSWAVSPPGNCQGVSLF
jgi:prepilin-type N-terminal cleavage/methylation domain-containing protein